MKDSGRATCILEHEIALHEISKPQQARPLWTIHLAQVTSYHDKPGHVADPQFVQAVLVSYNFEKQQRYKVGVYDADEKATDVYQLQLAAQDHVGNIEFDLAEVVRNADKRIRRPLLGPKASGTCMVHGEERITFRQLLIVDVLGYKLAKRDGCDAAGTACVRCGAVLPALLAALLC
jgi:hypothetical protein